MALQTATLESLPKGKYRVVDPRPDRTTGPLDFNDAIAALNTANAELLAEAASRRTSPGSSGPVSAKQAGKEGEEPKPAMVVYYGNQTAHGRFPVGTFYGDQFRAMLAGLPIMVRTFNTLASEGKIDTTWPDKQGKRGNRSATLSQAEIAEVINALQALTTETVSK